MYRVVLVASTTLRRKDRYDIRSKRPSFHVGQSVWLFDPRHRSGLSAKLQSWWRGPLTVTDIINDVVVRIHDPLKPRSKHRVVHVDRLAAVVPRHQPPP